MLDLIKIVNSFPKPMQAEILKIAYMQRRETYLTNIPNMLPMTDGNEFSKEFKAYAKKLPVFNKIKLETIIMEGGIELRALHLPSENGKLICAFHGIKGNWFDNPRDVDPTKRDPEFNPQYRMELLREFASDGFGFLAFTLPGFHPSGGSPSEENFNKACDAFVDYTIKLKVKPENIIVCGESLGGAAAAIFAKKMTERGLPPSVLSLIATFDSLIGITQNKFPIFSKNELKNILKEQLDTTQIFQHLDPKRTYLHIIEAENDKVIPKENSDNLLRAARSAQNGSFKIMHHPIASKHTTWNAFDVLNGKKVTDMARERGIEIAEHQTVKDIEDILAKKESKKRVEKQLPHETKKQKPSSGKSI